MNALPSLAVSVPHLFRPMNSSATPYPVSPLAVETSIRVVAPRAAVWRAFAVESEVKKWFGRDAWVELRAGGPFELYFLMDNPPGLRGGEGNTFTSWLPGRLLAFTWNAPPSFGPLRDVRTHVLLEFIDAPDDGTLVRLVHYGFGQGDDWREVHDYFALAWPNVLANLKRHLEWRSP